MDFYYNSFHSERGQENIAFFPLLYFLLALELSALKKHQEKYIKKRTSALKMSSQGHLKLLLYNSQVYPLVSLS